MLSLKSKLLLKIALTVAIIFLPQVAFAHLVSTRFGEFYSGLLHPITTFAHLIPWIAVGLLSAKQSVLTARWILLFFPLAILLGLFAAGVSNIKVFETLNLLSFVILGFFIVFTFSLPQKVFLLLVSFFGFTHGYANATEGLSFMGSLLYVSGVTVAGYVTVALITAGANYLSTQMHWGMIAIRVAGSWIVAIGLIYTGFVYLDIQTATT